MSTKFHDVSPAQYAEAIAILKDAPERVEDASIDFPAARYLSPKLFQYTLGDGMYTSWDREVTRFMFTHKCELLNVFVQWDMDQLRRTPGLKAYVAKSYYYSKYKPTSREALTLLGEQSMRQAIQGRAPASTPGNKGVSRGQMQRPQSTPKAGADLPAEASRTVEVPASSWEQPSISRAPLTGKGVPQQEAREMHGASKRGPAKGQDKEKPPPTAQANEEIWTGVRHGRWKPSTRRAPPTAKESVGGGPQKGT